MGNPILREVAAEISREELLSDEFGQLLADMHDSMMHYGGIGIAAPQIGVAKQVAIIELKGLNRYGEEINLPLTAFINPRIEYLSKEEQGFWEGCLSVPGLRGFVKRPSKVRVHYLDKSGSKQVLEADGFLATVLQHELDHLQGVLYVDRIHDSKLLAYQEEYDMFFSHQQTIE